VLADRFRVPTGRRPRDDRAQPYEHCADDRRGLKKKKIELYVQKEDKKPRHFSGSRRLCVCNSSSRSVRHSRGGGVRSIVKYVCAAERESYGAVSRTAHYDVLYVSTRSLNPLRLLRGNKNIRLLIFIISRGDEKCVFVVSDWSARVWV